mmetsp:Transcript_36186/g.79044  ORF Transcript_36186/g.79044 Transcript_36186/m.79044 type:complete len:307 (-) Transcript_36186:102-1022(-)|eukprot:CAMPEP_0170596856 /NCGR_PEP_ID=MMETSP0224-20130122/15365_1 /TAXON_ID=285029 /ORGANISM="Togula jolla, Strain CCCM 725" /LENGTH=306 /DNA_ID=CAMNT_0010921225 /DNA_START=105 /DNA_END=1025 /DNA_ORIENTATION=-
MSGYGYGAAQYDNGYGYGHMPHFQKPRTRSHSFIGIGLSIVLPWLVFLAVVSLLSFTLHYDSPDITTGINFGILAVIIFLGYTTLGAWRRRAPGDSPPIWGMYIVFACLLAWLAANAAGSSNFTGNMRPFYDAQALNIYTDINPSVAKGQAMMDAGRIVFTPDSKLDIQRSMAFHNDELYCVAPVITGNASQNNFDFWAVGINCCSGHMPDFHCGEFNNPTAISGLRLMREDQRPFFRLAVQQAEASFNMKASHPIFLYWMSDPMLEINGYQEAGFKFILDSTFWSLVAVIGMAMFAAYLFAKLGL